MAPPTEAPRLNTIDPVALANDAMARLDSHAGALLGYLTSPAVTLKYNWGPVEAHAGSIHETVRCLAVYAVTGQDPVSNTLAADRIADVYSALYTSACGRTQDVMPGDPTDALECVIVAAHVRMRLEDGHPVRRSDLGVLASVGERWIHQLVARGELTSQADGWISAREARRWLAARGVAGVTA